MINVLPLLFVLAPIASPGTPQALLRTSDVADVTGARELASLAASLPMAGPEALGALIALDKRSQEVVSRGTALVDAVRVLTVPLLAANAHVSLLADDRLAVVASPAQHEWIDGMLAGLRAYPDALVDVEATVFELPAGTLAGLSHPVAHGDVLGDEGAGRMLRELAGTGAGAVASPRLVAFPAQRASIAVVEQIPFVADYLPHAIGDEPTLVPRIDTVEDGVRMDMVATPTAGGRLVLSATVKVSSVVEPLATFDTTLGGELEKPVTFQLPEIREARGGGRFELPSGSHVVIAFDIDAEREVVVLVRASLSTAPGVERR